MNASTIAESEVPVLLEPGTVARWKAEDALIKRLGPDEDALTPEETADLLDRLRLTLPPQILTTELVNWAAARNTPLSVAVPAELGSYSYYLAEVPVNILAPDPYKVKRLCLSLEMESEGGSDCVAYDLYPQDTTQVTEKNIGEVNLDISKALSFVAGSKIADCLGFSLKFPLEWKSSTVRIETSDRMSNPCDFWVADESIQHGFTGYVIARVKKGASLKIKAKLACDVKLTFFDKLLNKWFGKQPIQLLTPPSSVRSYTVS